MHNRQILIGLTFLKPFMTTGDQKNFLGKAGASLGLCFL